MDGRDGEQGREEDDACGEVKRWPSGLGFTSSFRCGCVGVEWKRASCLSCERRH
jgi:hypothetical protein